MARSAICSRVETSASRQGPATQPTDTDSCKVGSASTRVSRVAARPRWISDAVANSSLWLTIRNSSPPVPWILLIDTLAGSMIFLSISGVILWWETHRKRAVGIDQHQ